MNVKCTWPETDCACGRKDAAIIARLRAEVERYRTAITDCIGFAAGRESEWGERAINAFGILEAALAAGAR